MLRAILTAAIVPPANLVWVCLFGVWLERRHRAVGRTIAVCALAGLIVLGLPITGRLLLLSLEDRAGPTADNGVRPAAIVILGGDVTHAAEDNGKLRPGPFSLERMLAGAALHRRTSLPILVTGGLLIEGDEPVAMPMVRTLEADLATPVRWVEPNALDTWQNARASVAMLRADGISAFYVVTHAWHMRRALLAFAGLGVTVAPAAVRFDQLQPVTIVDFLPQPSGWMMSYLGLHEWIGCAYYAFRR